MTKYNAKNVFAVLFIISTFLLTECRQKSALNDKEKSLDQTSENNRELGTTYKVTFIELGSVRCIPCRQMQAVMKSIESKYGKEVKIEFHDVWTEAGKPFAVRYGIESIPTQIFLDETGKEYYRHVGYFPEEELVKILQMQGIKLN